MFFAETQNKLLYAVTQKTASELVLERANPDAPNMGLTCWNGQVVRKGDVIVAKNNLNDKEIDLLNRLVTVFLETAEMRVMEGRDLTLGFWRDNVNRLLEFQGKPILRGTGSISNADMERIAKERYELFSQRRRQEMLRQADAEDMKELDALEQELKNHETSRR